MTALRLRILEVGCFERSHQLRMPFGVDVSTPTGGRQLVLRLRIGLEDGREAVGYSAEALCAKWFDKDLALSAAQNHHQLRRAVELAVDAYRPLPFSTAYGLYAASYRAHVAACAAERLNPLIASFGSSMIDRAVIDALCRAEGISYFRALQSNILGIRSGPLVSDLLGFDLDAFLAGLAPAKQIALRHTLGLVDPLTRADQTNRVEDGLPETLEEVVGTYRGRYYKIEISGVPEADLMRLRQIAACLEAKLSDYRITLDGNEQFGDAAAAADFYARLQADPQLGRFVKSILSIEQPIRRERALIESIAPLAAHVPVIIDESDESLEAFPRARALGYSGTSTKLCKGIYKSIFNAARAARWTAEGRSRYFLSAEDLTCEPGIALQQDLALVSCLGLAHVEKNAHHVIDGFDARPAAEGEAALAAHPDLYHRQNGRVRLKLREGMLSIGSLAAAGFGTALTPDRAGLTPSPRAEWPPGRSDA